MSDNLFKIAVLIFLFGITLMTLIVNLDDIKRPNLVSVDSVKTMSCNELHTNFNLCRQHSNTETWDYCAEVYLPLYYGKCI